MILLSNRRRLFATYRDALIAAHVPFVPPKEDSWIDTEGGRFLLGMIRIVCDSERDYVAHRLVLGCRAGVGPGTCHEIMRRATAANANYRNIFYLPLPQGVFAGRQITALNHARGVCQTLEAWTSEDDLALRRADIRALVDGARGAADAAAWDRISAPLPDGMTLGELRDYLWADNSDQRRTLLYAVHERLGLEPPTEQVEPGVRVLTMHGAKGLQADVVFIPALEQYVLPGPRRLTKPGLVQEGARLLYVSITRARAAAVLSFANGRYYAGSWKGPQPSEYCAHLGGAFVYRQAGLTQAEGAAIQGALADMQ